MELTSKRYPSVVRGNYASLDGADIKFFEALLGRNRVITDPSEVVGDDYHAALFDATSFSK